MDNSTSYSNNNDLASSTWPAGPLLAMGDHSYYAHPPVSQNTHPDFPFTAGSYVPGFNADDAALSLVQTTEMGAYASPPTELDPTNLVIDQCVGTSTLAYPNALDLWLMPTPRMFLSRICYGPSYSPMWIQSFLRRQSRGRPAAACW